MAGFSAIIYSSLAYRKRFPERNLFITADEVWQMVAERAALNNLIESNLLFYIKQDGSATIGILLFKDADDKIVGRIE